MESFSTTKLTSLQSSRNRLTNKQKRLQKIEEQQEEKPEPILNIYAELNKKQYRQVLEGDAEICVPNGVEMINKAGSRALFFECEDEEGVEELIMGLEASGISWQEDMTVRIN